jgi:hypothetical protein
MSQWPVQNLGAEWHQCVIYRNPHRCDGADKARLADCLGAELGRCLARLGATTMSGMASNIGTRSIVPFSKFRVEEVQLP